MRKPTCDVLIIGGGLAGASSAAALAKRGLVVCICEGENSLAQRASGNRFALLMPYITERHSVFSAVYSKGFAFTLACLNALETPSPLLQQVGGIQLPSTARLEKLVRSREPLQSNGDIRRIDPQEASCISGVEISSPGFFVPSAGFVSPRELIRHQVHEHAAVYTSSLVASLQQSDGTWATELANGSRLSSSAIVLCAAYESAAFDNAAYLPLEAIRGQTVNLLATPKSSRLQTIVCFDGYITPAVSGEHLIGAHYRHGDSRTDISVDDSAEIMDTAHNRLPALDLKASHIGSARVCFRTSTVDRLPYVGGVPDFVGMREQAEQFQPGTDLAKRVCPATVRGLFINAGHGSRGLLSCPMSGEIVARLISGEPLGELASISEILSPSRTVPRFLRKD